jgi:5-methylcytosine-specific restriction endonuclease McrA
MQRFSTVSDDVLLHNLHAIVGSHRRTTAELVAHLGEVDTRRLHVEKGFSSLFGYCVERLRFSEDEACRRIEAARLARRFPAIYSLMEQGAVSLTVLGLLKRYLTDGNHQELLAGVSGSSARRAKEWLAARFPEPDVPSTIRKQPGRHARIMQPQAEGSAVGRHARIMRPLPAEASASAAVSVRNPGAPGGAVPNILGDPEFRAAGSAAARARVEPLSQDRFFVKFTASRAMKEKLESARDLMRHANPGGEIGVVLERALDALIAELQKRKQGRTSRPRQKPRPRNDTHVTRAVRREVVARDGWRCSFVADDGGRCDASAFLEFDHQTPKGRGGNSRTNNLRLLCRAHNRWAAELVYGKAHVSRAIAAAVARRAPKPKDARP